MTKLSEPPYDDVKPFAQALIAANPERLVWATDWPHPHIAVDMPNDGDLVDMFEGWLPNEQVREQIYVFNAARLYDFDEG